MQTPEKLLKLDEVLCISLWCREIYGEVKYINMYMYYSMWYQKSCVELIHSKISHDIQVFKFDNFSDILCT